MLRLGFIIILTWITTACNNCRYGCDQGICSKSECNCFEWYEGDACERSVLQQYEGSYAGEVTELDTLFASVDFSLFVSTESPELMVLKEESLRIRYTDISRFEINNQLWRGGEVTGDGEMLLNGISMRMTFRDSTRSRTMQLSALKATQE